MVRRSGSFALFFLALVPGLALAFGQAAGSTPSQVNNQLAAVQTALPKHPEELMLLAARVNGLGSAGLKPWHAKATYQTFDADGKPKDQGVFEEWWAGPEKYKLSYASPSFNQVRIQNGQAWITGDKDEIPVPEQMVEEFLVHPLPPVNVLEGREYETKNVNLGAAVVKCFDAEIPDPYFSHDYYFPVRGAVVPVPIALPRVCFQENSPIVRVEVIQKWLEVTFNEVAPDNGQYVAKQFWVKDGDLAIVHVNLVELDFEDKIDDAVFAIPPSAVQAPFTKNRDITGGQSTGGKSIRYPPAAKRARIQGLVILQAVVTKTGSIGDVQVVSGPPELQQAAVDAVRTWKFKPCLFNGQPVDVHTQINLTFDLSETSM